MQKEMSLEQRMIRIREIDEQLTLLHNEQQELYRNGLTTEEHNILFDMVMADGKSHWG